MFPLQKLCFLTENLHNCFVDDAHKFLRREEVLVLLQELSELSFELTYDWERHLCNISLGDKVAQLRLPITVKFDTRSIDASNNVKYVMLLVQTGSASIGVFEGEKCLEHKVLSAYMVRKKQGKSQLKHLKTKGKSRAGSRVRLAKTLEFFENINDRLTRHFNEHEFERIAFSCSKILMPYLFNSKVSTPFDKKDNRIYRIPKHLHQPNYEVMLGMQRFMNKGQLTFKEGEFSELISLVDHL